MVETRYDLIREKLRYKEKEDIDINLGEEQKDMISIYEGNINMFIEKLTNLINEFNKLCTDYEDYNNMIIVQKMKMIIDAYEPVIFNLHDEINYLYSVLKVLAGIRKREEKAIEIRKATPEEKRMSTIILLRKKGYTIREISNQLGIGRQTVFRRLKKEGLVGAEEEREFEELEENGTKMA